MQKSILLALTVGGVTVLCTSLEASPAAIANIYAAVNVGLRIGTAATASGGLSSRAESIALSTLTGVASVPEPSIIALMLSGLVLVGLSRRRKK